MKNYLKFWGTRGSCSVSGEEYKKFGGNTCCLEIQYEGHLIIIDAGTGIRPMGIPMTGSNPIKVDLFLGHMHWDHIIGFPFFEPIYQTGTHITIWSPSGSGRPCKEIFNQLLSAEFFPVRLEEMQAHLDFRTTHSKTPVQLGSLTIDFHTTQHPGLTHCFKITTPHQTIGYITDNETLQGYHGAFSELDENLFEPHESLIQFMERCDLMIHEAQYSSEEYLQKEGWGHSSVSNAVSFLKKISPKEWLVTHHDLKHTDADLQRLEKYTLKLLEEQKIQFPVKWIADGYIHPLK